MIEPDTLTPDPVDAISDARNSSVSPLSDPGLAMLREQVKNIMIPLLIKVFHIKLQVQQASSPPSRLQAREPEEKVKELIFQLDKLDEDLKLMISWCQSCRNQVNKVLSEADEELKVPSPIHSGFETNPAVHKSFTEALAGHHENLKKAKSLDLPLTDEDYPLFSDTPEKNLWWDRFFKH